MIDIKFPDGSVRSYEQGVTGLQIAESISPALARDVLACGVNGETVELNRPITEDSSIALYKWDDDEGRHAFGTPRPTCLPRRCRNSILAYSSDSDRLSRTDSSMTYC